MGPVRATPPENPYQRSPEGARVSLSRPLFTPPARPPSADRLRRSFYFGEEIAVLISFSSGYGRWAPAVRKPSFNRVAGSRPAVLTAQEVTHHEEAHPRGSRPRRLVRRGPALRPPGLGRQRRLLARPLPGVPARHRAVSHRQRLLPLQVAPKPAPAVPSRPAPSQGRIFS